jgi:transposase-like protein
MNQKTSKIKRVTKYKKFSEAQQMKVAQEIDDGLIRASAAVRKYGFCQRTIYNWINKYSLRKLAQENYKTPVSLMQESDPNRLLVKKIKDLERALAMANLKVAALETTIVVAEKHLKIKIRKKAGTKQSSK